MSLEGVLGSARVGWFGLVVAAPQGQPGLLQSASTNPTSPPSTENSESLHDVTPTVLSIPALPVR